MPQTASDPARSRESDGLGPAVVYFAKAPRAGAVKTRLCPPLTPAEAAGLYGGFLQDTVRPVAGAAAYVWGWPADDLAAIEALVPREIGVHAQVGADLWARMNACFATLFERGHDRVLIRNTDSPDLPAARIDEALAAAGPGRVVLGPDAGGGYYLIALAAPCPELLAPGAHEEGAATVFASTVARAQGLGLDIVELAVERDVDRFDDLLALWQARRSS